MITTLDEQRQKEKEYFGHLRRKIRIEWLTELLTTTKGNIYMAAKLANMDRGNLYRMMKMYHVGAGDFRGLK